MSIDAIEMTSTLTDITPALPLPSLLVPSIALAMKADMMPMKAAAEIMSPTLPLLSLLFIALPILLCSFLQTNGSMMRPATIPRVIAQVMVTNCCGSVTSLLIEPPIASRAL